MWDLLSLIGRLSGWRKLVVVAMLIVIVLTWLSVCLILASYFVP
jgi:hypothetical protein